MSCRRDLVNEGGTHLNDTATELGVGVGIGKNVTLMQGCNWRLGFNTPGW